MCVCVRERERERERERVVLLHVCCERFRSAYTHTHTHTHTFTHHHAPHITKHNTPHTAHYTPQVTHKACFHKKDCEEKQIGQLLESESANPKRTKKKNLVSCADLPEALQVNDIESANVIPTRPQVPLPEALFCF